MGDGTNIEWTDASWQTTYGCSVVSPGCQHCYAMKMAARLEGMGQRNYAGLTLRSKAGAVWNGTMRFADVNTLTIPLRWKKPRRIFVNSMSDLFHEGVPDAHIGHVFSIMAKCPQHTFQVLTKRAARMRRLMDGPKQHTDWHPKLWHRSVLPNVWLGVSVEDQERANERIPDLLATPAAVRFLSCEPLLGPVDIATACEPHWKAGGVALLHQVIIGGESGPRRRPVDLAWMRSLRDQCAASNVAVFCKQIDKVIPLPPDLQQREFPA